MHYTYLVANIVTILIPFLFSFEKRINFISKWKFFFPACILTALIFCVWDYYATASGVWSFNSDYITGIKIMGLPLEEIMFFFTVPYACTFLYLNAELLSIKMKMPRGIHSVLLIIGVALLVLAVISRHLAYTSMVLLFSAITVITVSRSFDERRLRSFILAYLASLIPMLGLNGLLTSLPIVIYDEREILGLRLGTIPVEDFLYALALLGLNLILFEWLIDTYGQKKSRPLPIGRVAGPNG